MTQLLPQIKAKWMDDNNDPLVGGKVYTYIAGTQTPKPTYTDYAGETTNSNPVILDSRGEADIWLINNQPYKIVVTDANDVPVYTVDNVTGTGDSGGGTSLGKVFVSALDPVSGYLNDKLVAGNHVNLNIITNAGGDTIRIDAVLDGKVLVSINDTISGYLFDKIASNDGSIIVEDAGGTVNIKVNPEIVGSVDNMRQLGENSTTGANSEYTMTSGVAVKFKTPAGANFVTIQDADTYKQLEVEGEVKAEKVFIEVDDTTTLGSGFAPLAINDTRTNSNASLITGYSDTDNTSLQFTRGGGNGPAAQPMLVLSDNNQFATNTIQVVPSSATTFPIQVESGANAKASANFTQGIQIGDNSAASPGEGTLRYNNGKVQGREAGVWKSFTVPALDTYVGNKIVETDAGGVLVETDKAIGDLAVDSTVIHLDGTETVVGAKDFTGGLQKSGATVPSQTGLVDGNIVASDSNQNLVDTGKTVDDFTETQSFTDGNLAEFDSIGDLVDTGKTKENIAFKNEENIFTEINSFENSIVTGIADAASIYTGTANADIAVSLFKCPTNHCLFAGARSANQTHVTWYKKELGGSWNEYRTEVAGFGTGTRYAYVALPLRSGRVLIGTGFVNTFLYISDDGGETVSTGYTLDGTYSSILSGIQLRNGHIVLGLGANNGNGNLVYCTEQENAEDATVWKNIEMNARYDRIFALEEARTDELVVGTGSDLNDAYLVVFPDQNDLSTFNEYQIRPSDSLVRVTFLDCSDEAWLINCRDSSSAYKSYFTADKGVTIFAFPDITIEATTYNLVQLKYSSTGRLYASLRDGSGNCFISHCDNATAENITSDSLQWSPVEAVAVGTGASVTDMMEVDGKMYLAAGANGSVWLSERDYNNTLNREDGQFGAKVLSASKEIVEEGVTLEQKYAQLNKTNEFSQKQQFSEDVTLEKNIYSPIDPEFQKWGEVGAQFEQARRLTEITDGNFVGRVLVGTGTSAGDGLVHYSDDRGRTWKTSTGLPSFIRCDALLYISGDIVLAGFKGSTINSKVLYRSTDGGASFSVLDNFVPTNGDDVFAIVKAGSGRVLIGAGGQIGTAQVQYSDNITDTTPTFSTATGVTSDILVYSLFYDEDTKISYLGTFSGTTATIQKSTDNGATFSNVTSHEVTEAFVLDINKNYKTGVLYACCGTTDGKLLQSTDGETWTTKYTGSTDGYTTLFGVAFSPCGRGFVGTDSADILVSDDEFTTHTPAEVNPDLESARVMLVSSRYEILITSGSDAGDGDVWGAPLFNYAVIDDKLFNVNCRDYGAVHEYPTDAVCGDICFDVLDNEPHYYNGTEWLPTHLGEQTFLYLDWDGTASINHGAQNVWQVVKFWDADDFNQITYNGNTGADAGSYNFDLTHFGFWFRALLNLSIAASTGSHTVEFAIETKLDSEQWPEETAGAVGDNIVAGSIKPATIDSAGGSVTQVTRARITEKMQIRVITRCTSGANKITNFSYGVKEITRVA